MQITLLAVSIAAFLSPVIFFRLGHYHTAHLKGYRIPLQSFSPVIESSWERTFLLAAPLALIIHAGYWWTYRHCGLGDPLPAEAVLSTLTLSDPTISTPRDAFKELLTTTDKKKHSLYSQLADPADFANAYRNAVHFLKQAAIYCILCSIFAFIMGFLLGQARWNIVERVVNTIPNKWFYQLEPDAGKLVVLDVLSTVPRPDGFPPLYRGVLVGYFLDPAGELEAVVLRWSKRYEKGKRAWRAIPGERLIIPYKEIQNFNVTQISKQDIEAVVLDYMAPLDLLA